MADTQEVQVVEMAETNEILEVRETRGSCSEQNSRSVPVTAVTKSSPKSVPVVKARAVPILPKHVPTAVTRVAPLAPRPIMTAIASSPVVSAPLNGTHNLNSNESGNVETVQIPAAVPAAAAAITTNSAVATTRSNSSLDPNSSNALKKLDDDPRNSPSLLHISSPASNATEKQRRNVRPRAFTEEDDLALINFWASNYDIYSRVSKLAFARRAAEHLNKRSGGTGSVDRSPTHEKQVHNKICYLLRRYESLLPKYYRNTPLGDDNAARISMITIDSEFPYFSKMFTFMSNSSNSAYPRKRKALRSSVISVPNTSHSIDSENEDVELLDADMVLRPKGEGMGEHLCDSNGIVTTNACKWSKSGHNNVNTAEHSNANSNALAEDKDGIETGVIISEPIAFESAPNGVGTTACASTDGDTERDLMKISHNGNEDIDAARGGVSRTGIGFLASNEKSHAILPESKLNTKRDSSRQVYQLRTEELSLRSLEHKRLEAELDLRRRDLEHRREEAQTRLNMQLVHELRESAKTFSDIGMSNNAYKCMEKVAALLEL